MKTRAGGVGSVSLSLWPPRGFLQGSGQWLLALRGKDKGQGLRGRGSA